VTRWTIHGESAVYTSEWLNVRLVDVELPSGPRFSHHVVRMRHAAAGIVMRDPDRGVLLLRRHRFITDTWGWEIPAGRVEPNESVQESVEREAVEETGWRPLQVERLGASFPTNGLCDQQFVYFVSAAAEHVGAHDEDEAERVEWFAPGDVRGLIADGQVPDGLSVTALGMAFALGRIG
jgi:8-oxo-dGTP pyrophosphatase MutT (NUDIX family)